MKRKFEELRENLDEFVEQTEYPMLVVGCLSEELAYVCKFLQALEEKHPEHYFVIFAQPFTSPDEYVQGMVDYLRLQLEAAGPLRAERGDPPFPPLPPELADRSRLAEVRLRGILDYLRSLLPDEKQHAVVVGLLPLSCADFMAYARLVITVTPTSEVPPWLVALRIVAYDDRSQKVLTRAVTQAQAPHVLTYEVDFSTPALTDALGREAADTSLPVADRMAALMQLAALDFSYKRYPDALQKYGVLHNYYAEHEVHSMQALCLLGAGDTLNAAGRPAEAKDAMQRAVGLALEHKALAVLLNALLSIVDVCTSLGQHGEAESYADSGTQVAAGVMNPFAYADLFQKRGEAQIAQGKFVEGIVSYRKCEELCGQYEYFHRAKLVLAKQIEAYRANYMTRDERDAEHRLALVQRLEQTGGEAGLAKAQNTPPKTGTSSPGGVA